MYRDLPVQICSCLVVYDRTVKRMEMESPFHEVIQNLHIVLENSLKLIDELRTKVNEWFIRIFPMSCAPNTC